ncbi:MlaD family protein [Parabacteroides sp. PF5-9]|uniref:MlaD family protein n=1 Tax=Parabacteroides sp. PF5-9 TaxID=1742404 RepID=UPI002476B79F|nr:MlaD family protein [Parabacteroides sp. PF5-9]MDH6358269.1 phospholipid/cholesterol/gamma-HCH transport system substrate-binding protein [Parabacteroides sp. PF5-9]
MKLSFTKEAKIGLVTIISLALLYAGINYLKGINLFKPVNHYYVAFNNVKDLAISSPVYVEGFKVGLVRSISYDYNSIDKIIVEINLDKEMRINKDSYVVLEKTLMSGGELHLHLNKYVSEYIKSGSTIEGRSGSDLLHTVQENILPGVEALLPKIDSILGGLQNLVNHPALTQSLGNIEQTTKHLAISSQQLNQLLNKDVPVIVTNLTTMTENFADVSNDLKTLDFQSTINSINETLANLKVTTDKLNSPDNNLGLLLNDKTLYNNLTSTTESLDKLLIDFRENPKRYVHFSVF